MMTHTPLATALMNWIDANPAPASTSEDDPVVIAKLFDAFGSATWWLTQYDPAERIAFGFVTGFAR